MLEPEETKRRITALPIRYHNQRWVIFRQMIERFICHLKDSAA
jgi:hypothetical protein